MPVGPLILYSALIGALTGALVGGFVWLLRNIQALLMGEVLGYLPPGLAGENGLLQVFRGPNHWLFALTIPLIFIASSYVGLSRGVAWLLNRQPSDEPPGLLTYGRMLLGSLLQLSVGSPMGREGPMATLGHLLGSWISRRLPLEGAGQFLPFAGLAAGFAAAFHAPVAGALLAAEIRFRGLTFEIYALAPALIGALAGFSVYGALMGYSPLLDVQVSPLGWNALPVGLLLGLLAAGLGTLWLEASPRLATLVVGWPAWARHGLLGLLLAVVLLLVPAGIGDGLAWVQLGLSPIVGMPFLITLFLVRVGLVMVAGGMGAFGGSITPALALGGLLGLLMAQLLPALSPPAAAVALAGMSAMLAGVARAPFAALVLSGEIANYSLLPLVLPAVFVAYVLTSARTFPETWPEAAPPLTPAPAVELKEDRPAEGPSPTENARQTLPPPPVPGVPD